MPDVSGFVCFIYLIVSFSISNQCGECEFVCPLSAGCVLFRALDFKTDSGEKWCQAEKI